MYEAEKLAKIIKDKVEPGVLEVALKLIHRDRATRQELNRIEFLRKKAQHELDDCRRLVVEVQNRTCPHLDVQYHGDPAGGSDSCYVCDTCGAESRRGFDDPLSKLGQGPTAGSDLAGS